MTLAPIFHVSHSEALEKADEATLHSSALAKLQAEKHKISGLGITGGTGFIGRALCAAALEQHRSVILFSRHPESEQTRKFTTTTIPNINGCDQLIHLAGESIFGLWTKEKRRRILESRREGTRRLVEAIEKATVKPSLLISASAIGYYGNRGDTCLEETAEPGSGFLSEVAQVWEEEAMKAEQYGVRVVLLRTGICLGRDGGIMQMISPLFRLGLGAKLGSGNQWLSCIHVNDLARLILHCCHDTSIHGPINAVMPDPLTNAAFTKALGAALQKPTFFRAPSFALKMGLGELSTLLLDSQRVIPAKAMAHNFSFQYPTVEKALEEIV